MERKIYNTKPDSFTSEVERKCYETLESLGMAFERAERIEQDNETEQVYKLLGIRHLKNLLLCNASRSQYYLLVMPADVPFKSSVLSKQLGTSRFSFAPDEALEELLGLRKGYVSLMGLINDKEAKINLCFDERVLEDEYFGCLPCSLNSSIKLKTDDVLNKFLKHTGHIYSVVRM